MTFIYGHFGVPSAVCEVALVAMLVKLVARF
jgi:hypothetical protein